MRTILHLAVSVAALCLPAVHQAQVLISDSLLLTFTQQELIDTGVGNAINGIEVYRLRYWSTDADGQPIVASGAMMVPTGDTCYHSILKTRNMAFGAGDHPSEPPPASVWNWRGTITSATIRAKTKTQSISGLRADTVELFCICKPSSS